uniref:THAP-type domain-containing protein n=1 Tax=Leptobrachium leishanense TaxID=445787 RepID=A0A8C5PWD9_9ANUR
MSVQSNYDGRRTREKGVTLHSFPKDVRRRLKICSDHFTQDCFNLLEKRKLLSKNAIPTIFKKNTTSIFTVDFEIQTLEDNYSPVSNVMELSPISNMPISDISTTLDTSQFDPLYVPDTTGESIDVGEKSLQSEPTIEDYVLEKKFIVFESNLDELLKKINKCTNIVHCDAPIMSFEKETTGCLVRVYSICEENHKCFVWKSQPMIGRRSIGIILASSAILFSGSHFAKMNEYFKLLGVPFISRSVHYVYQKKFYSQLLIIIMKTNESRSPTI